MEYFESVKAVVQYLQDQQWRAKDRETDICSRTIYGHIKQGYLKRQKDGSFAKTDVDEYAQRYLDHATAQTAKSGIQEAIDRERLRKLQIENDLKVGKLVSLSEEVKRRVAVIQGMKTAMINGKAVFMRQLRTSMKERHKDTDLLDNMLTDAAEFYEDCVLEVFDDIGNRGRV